MTPSTPEFLDHVACFRELALSPLACSIHYKAIMAEASGNSTRDEGGDTVMHLCCGYGNFLSCSMEHVSKVPVCSKVSLKGVEMVVTLFRARPSS